MSTGPGVVGPTAFAETHCAIVLFVGDRAYKFKKPINLGFLDFSTRAARQEACRREVDLNSRLAPDVYLGVADVVGPDGEVCDHLVVMHRMPDDRRLSTLLERGETAAACLRSIARQIAALHAEATTSRDDPAIGQTATRDAVAGNWSDNFDTIRPFVDQILPQDEYDRVHRLATRYLEGRKRLFDRRIATGMARDGHGDLLAEDIFCVDDGPRILDCLEFADRYRYGDVLIDVAFLAMDLERLGHPAAAAEFLDWYAEYSGEHHPQSLAHHYIAYRAHVRVKVACLRYAQGDAAMADQARDLHRLVLRHLRRGRIVLALVGGLPGTGKSTVASGLSDTLEWALLRSDEIRKDLAGLGHTASARGPVNEGLYRPERVAETYRELLRRAEELLESGVPVILDASWSSAADRRAAAELADATDSDLVQIHCETGLDVARARLAGRPVGADASDATGEVLDALAGRADPWPQATTVRTDLPIDRVLQHAREAVMRQLDLAEDGNDNRSS
jgi:uncharacterized protein